MGKKKKGKETTATKRQKRLPPCIWMTYTLDECSWKGNYESPPEILKHAMKIQKYSQNHHLPSA